MLFFNIYNYNILCLLKFGNSLMFTATYILRTPTPKRKKKKSYLAFPENTKVIEIILIPA